MRGCKCQINDDVLPVPLFIFEWKEEEIRAYKPEIFFKKRFSLQLFKADEEPRSETLFVFLTELFFCFFFDNFLSRYDIFRFKDGAEILSSSSLN